MTEHSHTGWNPLNGKKCKRKDGGKETDFTNSISLSSEFVYLFHINILSIYSASSYGWSGIKIQIIYFLK